MLPFVMVMMFPILSFFFSLATSLFFLLVFFSSITSSLFCIFSPFSYSELSCSLVFFPFFLLCYAYFPLFFSSHNNIILLKCFFRCMHINRNHPHHFLWLLILQYSLNILEKYSKKYFKIYLNFLYHYTIVCIRNLWKIFHFKILSSC